MVIDSLLGFVVFRYLWGWPLSITVSVVAPLALIELTFFGANLMKLLDGGYVPVLIAGLVGTLMATWVRGTAIVQAKARVGSVSLETLIGMLQKSKPARAPGTAVFLTSDRERALRTPAQPQAQ